jgi:scyllo-inositol 2-dehydrogenase (NADP+)
MPDMPVNVGLVGFGYAARVLHRPLILACGMHIAGVVSRHPGTVHAILPSTPVFPDVESLLKLPGLDIVVVATPNDLHEPQAMAALAAGKVVVVDKPVAPSTDAADRLIQAANRGGTVLSVFHNRRWDGDFLTVRRLIDSDALGAVHTYEAHWNRYRPEVLDRWREQAAHGGGLLNDLGTHLIDQALLLFGTPEWLQADVFCQRANASVDDAFELRMGIGRLRIILSASCLSADPGSRFRIHGELGSYCKSGLDVQEEQLKGGLSPHDPAFGREPDSQRGFLALGNSAAPNEVPSERGNWLDFYRRLRACVESGAPPPVQAAEAREGLRIIEAARQSSESGQRIQLR